VTGLLAGAAAAMLVALGATPVLIRFCRARGIGQPIHDAVSQHAHKSGTPTMGGVVITIGLVFGYGLAHALGRHPPSAEGLRVVLAVSAAAAIGLLDDALKVVRRKNLGGLRARQKSVLQFALIGAFCAAHVAGDAGCTNITFTRCDGAGLAAGSVMWLVFAVAFFWGTMNAVNFGDGIEGLLAGSGTVTFTALALVAFWQFRHAGVYGVSSALDFAVVASCIAAGCVGFLWWNGSPMTVFMGDTGSLALGAGLAALSLSMNVPLLVGVLGAVYATQGISSGLQIATWKWYFKPRGGHRRLFRMAPIHHHFEVVGWSEATIVVRFWILNALAAAAALAVLYLDAIRQT
jgi:phospho-N-acetylmuramoyl-pentapeptide-transferase